MSDGDLGPDQALVKGVLDRVVASGLLVILAPVMCVCAVLIKCSDVRGPVIEPHARVDRRGRVFDLLNFRVPAGRRAGAFIESRSLHHLPELFNVLRGDMSLVGPRPRPVHDAGGPRRRLRPGLSGLWVLSDAAEPTGADLKELERDYAASWSISGDISILARTVAAVRYKP